MLNSARFFLLDIRKPKELNHQFTEQKKKWIRGEIQFNAGIRTASQLNL